MVPSTFIVNIDESGFQDYQDEHDYTCVVPKHYQNNQLYILVDKNSKRVTLLGGIYANDDCIRPLVILQRETIEAELYLNGYTTDHAHYTRTENGYIIQKYLWNWPNILLFLK